MISLSLQEAAPNLPTAPQDPPACRSPEARMRTRPISTLCSLAVLLASAGSLHAQLGRDLFARTAREVYAPGEAITVHFAGLPGATGDWIAIVKPQDPDETHGAWQYAGGKTSGTLEFAAMPEGEYEVRTYFDWPAGGYNVR